MTDPQPKEHWTSGETYAAYVGRWSRVVAPKFLQWLEAGAGRRWLDVGCGTGELTRAILDTADPAAVTGIDRSPDYVEYARSHSPDGRARFEVGDAQALPVESCSVDVVVSGLVVNFIPQPESAVAEMIRAACAGGLVAAYVWDYADRMRMIRLFWDAAAALDATAADLDEGKRFPLCRPEALRELFASAGLHDVDVRPIDIATDFRDFDDYWTPFLGQQGPAPSYVAGLGDEQRALLRERLKARLPIAPDGSISLVARAWAVRGTVGSA